MKTKSTICYLCGKPITDGRSRDHVPPLQFFPSHLRKKASPNLLTLPTHIKCNQSYQKDEDYFLSSLFPITENSPIHSFLLKDIQQKLWRDEGMNLYRRIMNEFDERPSGLYLPNEMVKKKTDIDRIKKIMWKIARGLHFFHFMEPLHSETPFKIKFYQTGDSLPEPYYKVMGSTPFIGDYPEVFCYKVYGVSFLSPNTTFYSYFLVLWNSIGALMTIRK